MIGPVATKLDLQGKLNIHPVFHISQLKHYKENDQEKFPDHHQLPPPPIHLEDSPKYKYEVESILDSHTHYRKKEYLVKWKGYPDYEAMWEPLANLKNAKKTINEYEHGGKLHASLFAISKYIKPDESPNTTPLITHQMPIH
jgi:Chromo (CHRromatin Organisation MOdifier) domain